MLIFTQFKFLIAKDSAAPYCIADQDSTRSTQLPPSIESRKQVSNVAKADQTNVSQASTGPDATPSAADLRGPTSSETTHPSEKIQESTPDAYLTDAVKPLLSMTGKTIYCRITQYIDFGFS